MSVSDIVNTAAAIVVALGGGGAIVIGLSSFLGKVWAQRLMEEEKHAHNQELQLLRSRLERIAAGDLEVLKKQLEVGTTTHLRETTEKIQIYRAVVDLVTEVLADFDRFARERVPLADGPERLDRYNRQRIKIYGYMAMLAPQHVMDAYNELTAHLSSVASGSIPYEWTKVRALGINLLNHVRIDVGLDKSPIVYRER